MDEQTSPEGGAAEAPLALSAHTDRDSLSNEIGADFAPISSEENRQSVKFKIENQKLVVNPSEKGSWKSYADAPLMNRLESNASHDGEYHTSP